MKKIGIVLLSIMLTLLSFCSCDKEQGKTVNNIEIAIPSYGNRCVVAFGDSIAAGYGLENQEQNYVGIFSKNIGASLRNHAVSGYDSDDLLKYLKSGVADYDIRTANIIILSIGGNDLLHEKNLLTQTLKNALLKGGSFFPDKINNIYNQYEKNLAECIDFLTNKNPNAVIIIQTVYNPAENQEYKISVINVAKYAEKYIDRLNESINTVCKDKQSVYVFDIAEQMNSDNENYYDFKEKFDIHPTVKGHQTLADIFTENFNMIFE